MSTRTHASWLPLMRRTAGTEVAAQSPAQPAAPIGITHPRKTVSVALVLLVLNCAVFLAMVLSGVSWMKPTSEQLVKWGACYGPLTLQSQWWRLLTATFIHIGIVHLALNMWCLWELGKLAETLFDKWSFLLIYLLSGIAGEITSVGWSPRGISAGASGAIFGLTGALIAALKIGKLPVPREQVKETLRSVLLFAGYNLVYGAIKSNIDNAAHVGGLVAGLLIGTALSQHLISGPEVRARLRFFVFVGSAVLLFASFTMVRRQNGRLIRRQQAEEALQRGDVDHALPELQDLSKSMPREPTVHALLGRAYLQKKQYDQALPELQRAVQLSPGNTPLLYSLGWTYMALRRFDDAEKTFAEVVRLTPNEEGGYISRGIALENLQRHEDAIEAFRKATQLAPFSAQAYYDLGIACIYAHRFDDALAAFKEVVRLKPQQADGYIGLGNAYLNKGMRNEAADAFRTAAELKQKGR
jgi:membrane associated rhomboid family serine protease/Flp pilus assembly protein TadD